MNKLRYDIIKRISGDFTITNDEFNMIIFLAKVCDDWGEVQALYYKYYIETMDISKSQFYKIKKSLEQKGYISCSKKYIEDIDICLNWNSFEEYVNDDVSGDENGLVAKIVYKDYMNLNREMFEFGSDFYNLKVNEKKILLELIKQSDNNKARIERKYQLKAYSKIFRKPMKMIADFASMLDVEVRTVKSYFEKLNKWISTCIVQGSEIVTIAESEVRNPKIKITDNKVLKSKDKPARFDSDYNYIKNHCRRYKIDYDKQSLIDTANLVSQFINKAKEVKKDSFYEVIEAIHSLEEKLLNAAAINRYISNKFRKILNSKNNIDDELISSLEEKLLRR